MKIRRSQAKLMRRFRTLVRPSNLEDRQTLSSAPRTMGQEELLRFIPSQEYFILGGRDMETCKKRRIRT